MKEGTPSSKSKQTTVKRRTPTKRKSVRQEAGRATKYWGIGACALAMLILAWALWPLGSDTYYIDGVSVRLSEQDVNLRDVVWETPTPVFKESADDVDFYDPAVSSDDQLMIFVKGRPREGADLYMARRNGEDWDDPEPLASINTDDDELGPALSRDGKWLFFYSNRAGGQGGYDLWASRRDTEDWGLPVNLGLSINTRYDEIDPSLYDKPETIVENSEAAASERPTAGLGWVIEHLYFASSRPTAGKEHIKPNWKGTARESLISRSDFNLFRAVNESATQTDLQFANAQVLDALNTSGDDAQPAITRRGDFLYFASNGRGSSSGFDLFRSRVFQGVFQPVEKLGNSVNTAANETDPTLLREGHQLLFSSDRNSGDFHYQLYQTVSREVFPFAEAPPESVSSWTFFDLIDKYKWWFALLLLSLLALLALLKNFIDESRRAQLTLMQRCLMASLAMHMLLAFLLSLWLISEAIYKHVKEEMVEITLDSGALAAQEEEQALRKPVEAQLTRASASLPEPQQVNPQAAPSAQPTQPVQPRIDAQQAQLQELALQPSDVTLPEKQPQELLAPRLPADPNQSSMPQLPRELLEISKVKPVANPQSAPVHDKLKAQPVLQQLAEVNPTPPVVRPPTPTAQKPNTSKPLEQTVDTRVDPTRLTPVEPDQSLPAMEVSETSQKMELAKNAAETSQKMVQASKQVEVQAQVPTVNPAQPASANTQVPTAQRIQAANAPPKKLPVESDIIKLPELETAQPQEQPPSTQIFQVSAVKQETSTAATEIARQMAEASDAQAVSPKVESVDKANPDIAESSRAVQAVKSNASTAVAKKQAVETSTQSITISKATAQQKLPGSKSVQASAVKQEATTDTAETAHQTIKASADQSVAQKNTLAEAAQGEFASTQTQPVKIAKVTTGSAVAKERAIQAAMHAAKLAKSSNSQPLTKTATAAADSVALEQNQSTPDSGRQMAQASSQQSVAPQSNQAAQSIPVEAKIQSAQAAHQSAQIAVKLQKSTLLSVSPQVIQTTQIQSQLLPKGVRLNPIQQKFEQAKTGIESSALLAKASSSVSHKAASTSVMQRKPVKAQSVLMGAAKAPAASAVAKSQAIDAETQSTQLSTAPSANPLEQTAIVQATNVTLEQAKPAFETVQALGQASRNVKVNQSAKSADVSKDSPSITSRTVEVAEVAAADSTTATRQTIDRVEVQPRQLASAPARPIPAKLALPELLDVKTETTLPTASLATNFDTALRSQSVRTSNQFARQAPQIAVQPLPFLASANPHIDQVTPRQTTALTSYVPGQPLSGVQPDNTMIDAPKLPGVLMEALDSAQAEVARSGEFQSVNNQGVSMTIKQDAVVTGQPLPVMKEAVESQVKVEEIKVVEQRLATGVVVSSSPFEDARDSSDTLNLPDIDIPDAPLLEAPVPLKNPLVLRNDPKKRMEIIDRLGGSEETERAIMQALDWFTRNQEKDGHWDGPGGHDHAATGMAMLAYMGWGAKHTEPGPYQKSLAKAVDWMVKHTGPDGDLRGARGRNFMYDHGIAAIAIAEAYSLTKDPKLRSVVERVVGFTVRAQNPKTGGWRYRPYGEERYTDRGDMSVTGWQIMALKSAQIGGVEVPLKSLDRALMFMDRVGGGRNNSIYGYVTKSNPNPAMVSEGMFCQQLLRQHAIDRSLATPRTIDLRVVESAKYIGRHFPNQKRLEYNYYYWYYACLALHQQQGPIWERWNNRIRPILLKAQLHRPDRADLHGSWDPMGKWGSEAGRCIVTGMATLSLEVYYRYLPMYTPTWAQKSNKGK